MQPSEGPSSELALIPVAITLVRSLRQWSQKELAAAMGVHPSRISKLEAGDAVAQPPELLRLCRASGIGRALFKRLVTLAGALRAALGDETAQATLALALDLAAGVTAKVNAVVQVGAAASLTTGAEPASAGSQERNLVLWQRLQPFPSQARRFLVQMGREYQSTSFCLFLCDQSEQMAGHAAGEASKWARLAREVARHVPEETAFRLRLTGLALGFWGNAWRAKGKLRMADEAFAHARARWEAGADPEGRLPGWRLDALEATLRIQQDRFRRTAATS